MKDTGSLCFQPLATDVLVVRILGFHPGYPGLIPRQGAEMSLQDCSLLSLSKIIIVYVADFYFSHPDAEAEVPVFWSSDANRRFIGKVPDAGKD